MSGADRREHARFDVSVRVQFKDLGALQEEETKNLSRGGALVVARQMRPMGSKIPVTLVHPVNGTTLDILAEVKRVQPLPNGTWALGVQFVGFDQALKLRIHDFVDSIIAAPAAPPAAAPGPAGKLNEYLGIAAREESSGSWRETLRYLDLALALAPDRADIHAWKARIADKVQDRKTALAHIQRARELDAANEGYAKAAAEYAAAAATSGSTYSQAVPVPADVASAQIGPSKSNATMSRRGFLPRGAAQWTIVSVFGAAAVGTAGYNLWYFVLRNRGRGPRSMDPKPYRDLVPLRTLKRDGTRAFGVVEPGWTGPGRDAKVSALATRLSAHGITDLFLTDEKSKLVATSRGGTVKVY